MTVDKPQTIEELQTEIASLRAACDEYDRKIQEADRWQAKFAEAVGLTSTATNGQILDAFYLLRRTRQMLGAAAARLLDRSTVPKTYDDGDPLPQYTRLNLLVDSGVVAHPDQINRLRTDCDEYRRKCGDAYLWQLEIADALKLPSFTDPEQILDAIRRLKTYSDFWRDVAYRHLANVALYLGLPDPESAPEHLVLRTVRDVVAKLKTAQSEVK